MRSDQFNQPEKIVNEADAVVQHYGTERAGIEFQRVTRNESVELLGAKIAKGVATSQYRQLESRTYRVRNMSRSDREVALEHQVPPGRTFVGDAKPIADSTDRFLFLLRVAPGKVAEQTVREIGQTSRTIKLAELDEDQARPLLASAAVSEPVKAVLREALKQRSELERIRKTSEEARAALKVIVDEQGRLRANLERLPAASAAYKRYLEKFDTQETQIEKLQLQIGEADKAMKRVQKENSDFVARATAE